MINSLNINQYRLDIYNIEQNELKMNNFQIHDFSKAKISILNIFNAGIGVYENQEMVFQ